MKWLSDIGLLWILCGGLFILGLLVGTNWPELWRLRFSSQIDPANVFNGVVILGVGLLIDYRYRKLTEAKQSDTGLLLEDVRRLEDAFQKLRDAFSPCEAPHKKLDSASQLTLTAAARSLSDKVYALEQGLNHCNVDLQRLGFDSFRTAAESVSEIVTNDPYPGPYSEASVKRIIRKFDAFSDELTHMPYKINQR